MPLNQEQIDSYHDNGFLVMESALDAREVECLRAAFVRDAAVDGPQRVLEDGSDEVRAVYASHLRQPEFSRLIRDERVLGPVRQLLAEQVYLYQMKINAKPAFGGERWSWHQDYVAWRIADSLPRPDLINVGVLLDAVDEFNGPLIFVPGSHRAGLLRENRSADAKSEQHLDPDDIALGPNQLAALVDDGGMVSPKGAAGSLLFFSPEIVHGSAPNMSPYPRRLLLATFNHTANLPSWSGEPRPEYVVCRDTAPMQLLDEPFSRGHLEVPA